MSDGGFSLVIPVKSVRQKSYQDVKRLERGENIIVSEREVMCSTPGYLLGAHIRVELIGSGGCEFWTS